MPKAEVLVIDFQEKTRVRAEEVLQVLSAQANFHAEIVRDLLAVKQRLHETSFCLALIFLCPSDLCSFSQIAETLEADPHVHFITNIPVNRSGCTAPSILRTEQQWSQKLPPTEKMVFSETAYKGRAGYCCVGR